MPCVYFKDGKRINFQDRAFADSEMVKRLLKAGAINIPRAPVDPSAKANFWREVDRRKLEDDPVVRGIVDDLLRQSEVGCRQKK